MRIAVTVWQSRVSPVFDTAGNLLILDTDESLGLQSAEESILGLSPQKRVDRLADLDVDVLLCGAISRPLADMVAASGIRLVPWVTGGAEELLQWYLTGEPLDSRFLMPGCRQRRHRSQGRRYGGPSRFLGIHPEEDK